MRRSLPAQPSLRFIKIEAKRRLAAGEFPALHAAQAAIAREFGFATWAALKVAIDHPALAQLSWIVGRFRDADEPAWVPPGDDEIRAHFDDRMLAAVPPPELVRQIAAVAVQLRAEMIVLEADEHHARVRLAGLDIVAGVDSDPPYRIVGLSSTVPDNRIADPRVASPPTRILGDAPADAQAIAADEHGSPAIVIAGGIPTWVVAHGRADLERGRPVDPGDRLPAYGVTALVTATAVLRLVAEGRVDLDQPANAYLQTVRLAGGDVTVRQLLSHSGGVNSPALADMFADRIPDLADLIGPVVGCDGPRGIAQPSNGGYAVLGQLLADVTGWPYAEAVTRLVLEPLGMRHSSFPTAADPDGFIGYTLNPDGMFVPAETGICTIPAVGGLWADAVDLVRLGTGWSSLLPPALVDEALTAPDPDGPDGFTVGGWLLDPDGDLAMHAGTGPGVSAAIVLRTTDRRVRLVVVNRPMPLPPVVDRLFGTQVLS